MDFKNKILDALEKLRQKELANKETFKVRAYANVIKNLNASDKSIHTLDDIKDIKGIGKSIYDKIKEILETGNLKQVEAINEKADAVNDLIRIHGIGPAKAKDLFETHNIKTVEDLKKHQELLNDKQKMGLRYCEDFEKRIPVAEMKKHDEFIAEMIKKYDPKLKVEVVGSYRRGAKESGDIDIIITHSDNPKNYDSIIQGIVTNLKKEKYLYDDFALGTHKYLGVCKMKRFRTFRRIDILYSTNEVWPFSIFYFTGNVDFNVLVRNIALSKGLSLSEYGLKYTSGKNKGEMVSDEFKSEEDILKYLGLKYIEPSERNAKIDITKYKL
jgi:DNA polymerase beta